jgi:predicted GIY-YIG superfamily endonuclease
MLPGDVLEFHPDVHYVYGLYGDDGSIFYIGRSNCPQARLSQHFRGSGNAAVTERLGLAW